MCQARGHRFRHWRTVEAVVKGDEVKSAGHVEVTPADAGVCRVGAHEPQPRVAALAATILATSMLRVDASRREQLLQRAAVAADVWSELGGGCVPGGLGSAAWYTAAWSMTAAAMMQEAWSVFPRPCCEAERMRGRIK